MGLSLPLDSLVETTADLVIALLEERQSPHRTTQPYMTAAEAAEYLRCKPKRVYNLCDEGRLSRVKEGSRLLLLRSEIEALVTIEPARLR